MTTKTHQILLLFQSAGALDGIGDIFPSGTPMTQPSRRIIIPLDRMICGFVAMLLLATPAFGQEYTKFNGLSLETTLAGTEWPRSESSPKGE